MNNLFDEQDKQIQDALLRINRPAPDIMEGIREKLTGKKHNKIKLRTIVICAILSILLTSAVFALSYPSFARLLEQVPVEFSEYLEPIEQSVIYDGIKMEVVGLGYYDNQLKAYITLQDLTGNRINEGVISHMDFISVTGANGLSTKNQGYFDADTGILTFPVEASTDGVFASKELTFTVKDIYNNKREYENFDTGISLNNVLLNPKTEYVEGELISQIARMENYWEATEAWILAPEGQVINIPSIETCRITNIGVVNDKLRLQLWRDYDNMGTVMTFYLINQEGEKVEGEMAFSYSLDDSGQIQAYDNCYWEMEFDIDIHNLNQYRLFCDVREYDKYPGKWQVTVTTSQDKITPKVILCDVNVMDFHISELKLTPFGLQMHGVVYKKDIPSGGLSEEFSWSEIILHREDGDTITSMNYYSVIWGPEDAPEKYLDEGYCEINAMWDAHTPVNVNTVTAITIKDQTIEIDKSR